jgi:hypothetical protein
MNSDWLRLTKTNYLGETILIMKYLEQCLFQARSHKPEAMTLILTNV